MRKWGNEELLTRVARAMTDVEPADDFDVRLRARLDDTRRGHGRVWPIGAMVATAAAVVIAVAVWPRPASLTPTTGAVAGVSSPAVVEPLPAQTFEPVVTAPSAMPARPRVRPTRDEPAATELMTSAEREWMARRIPALPAVEALPVEYIALPSIQPEALSITPLTMTPLTVSPVSGDPNRL